ncbi:ABC transporter ATP-binding protein [Microlunatus sp. Gsoil 973]|uniref:ABC transporter ATP-binding protein n=1 Tax=Microlunatus sp. Gsoil 973 TaxID=2672569 RepID=UPI0012B44D9F|nr:ABC transporter ATP-binding protein [Microlunatus sp. Gsoil 973]QGN32182.1 ATP-binding cassette domain-containing protein [Microlunatus sp. Gsoil 973]
MRSTAITEAPGAEKLPGPMRTLARSMQLAYQAEPRLIILSLGMALLEAVPDSLYAVWLMLLGAGVADRNSSMIIIGCFGLAASTVASWLLQTVASRIQRTFRLRVGAYLEGHVARLQARVPTIEHQERPEYLDRLSVLKEQVWQLDHLYLALFSVIGSAVRLAITLGLVAGVHPALTLMVIFAAPTVWVSSRRSAITQQVTEKVAPQERRHRHLFTIGTTQQAAKEVRIWGIGADLVRRRRLAWESWYRPMARTRWASAGWQAACWAIFAVAYLAAIVITATVLHGSAADVLLIVTAGSRLSQYVAMTAGNTDFLRMCLDASQRLTWLESYASGHADRATGTVPARLERGITFENVSFRYPGAERYALEDISVHLPAGSVVAVVGENGAGKSTLMKLLSRFYPPTNGRIVVDEVDLQQLPATSWRSRLTGAYQDFFSFELAAQQAIGVGDLPRSADRAAVGTAVARAGAGDVVERLPQGLDTQLGPTWDAGVDLSFGQWQKLALARGFMRDGTLLQILDEPTAALDAETEHGLFESFARQARTGESDGRITVLVSHRFSTVRMADLILVLQGARLVEAGSHRELMAADGLYAELYGIQAAAYRR